MISLIRFTLTLLQGDAPFVIIDKNESLPVEKRFTGFCIDIVRELAKPEYMNFNYTVAIQTHGTGSGNEKTGRWSGIIGELIDQVNVTLGSTPFRIGSIVLTGWTNIEFIMSFSLIGERISKQAIAQVPEIPTINILIRENVKV
jgi:hypothetical protein